jgi:hypothetical protein
LMSINECLQGQAEPAPWNVHLLHEHTHSVAYL